MLMSAYLTKQLIKTEAPKEKKHQKNFQKKNILTTREISFFFFLILLDLFICISSCFYQEKFQTMSSKSELTVSKCLLLLKQYFE